MYPDSLTLQAEQEMWDAVVFNEPTRKERVDAAETRRETRLWNEIEAERKSRHGFIPELPPRP